TQEGQWGREKILGRANYLKEKNQAFYKAFRKDFISAGQMFTEGYKLYKYRINTVVKFLEDNHANLIFGTDGVAMNMYTNPPGYNGFLEMKHWAGAGISLETLFKAVTINNARTFHIDNLYGSVEKNKIANLVILDADPLKDVNAYNKIDYIIMRGEVIKREKLSAD
ncbi:MAG: amidohydrolase family protein, partial [Ferruginibacter sp.]